MHTKLKIFKNFGRSDHIKNLSRLNLSYVPTCIYNKAPNGFNNLLKRSVLNPVHRLNASKKQTLKEDSKKERIENYFKPNYTSPFEKRPLAFWKFILKKMWTYDSDRFRETVKKQKGKVRLSEDYGPSYYEAVEHLEQSPEHTLALSLTKWKIHFLCIDIDIGVVGEYILELMNKDAFLADEVFGYPLIIKTPTPGHLHLYYDCHALVESNLEFKRLLPTRLGFKAEYVRDVITFAGSNRIPLLPEKLRFGGKPSIIPRSMFPYNYQKNDNLYHLIEKKKTKTGQEFIRPTEDLRNRTLFNFLRVDRFSFEHILATNYLCLDPPLSASELKSTIFKSIGKRYQKQSTSKYDTFELALKPISSTSRPSPEFLVSLDPRDIKAITQGTPKETREFIYYLEDKYVETFDDDKWMGRSFDYVISYILLYKKIILLHFIKDESTYVYWNQNYWQTATENEVVDFSYNSALSLGYGAVEERVARRAIMLPLKNLCTINTWPSRSSLFGYNFLNGIVYPNSETKKIEIIPHDPKYMHREIIETEFKQTNHLDLAVVNIILDMTKGKVVLVTLFRYALFLCLNSHYGNTAYIFYGPGGAGKSVLTNFMRGFFPFKSVGTIDDTLLSKAPASKSTLVKDKSLIILPDITNRSLSPHSVEFVKVLTGRDQVATDAKYKDALNFVSQGFLVATSNQPPSAMNAFKDSGFSQRFIQYPTAGVAASERIAHVGELLSTYRAELAKWALTINLQFVKKNLRADNINAITCFELTDVEQFLLDKTVYEKGNRETTYDLATAFYNYKKDLGELNEEKKYNFSTLIGRSMGEFSQKVLVRQHIDAWRNKKERGFVNIALLASSELLKPNQQRFQFKVDPELVQSLHSNPYQDHGLLYMPSEGNYVQENSPDLESEAHNTVVMMALAKAGTSSAQITRNTPLTEEPYSHSYNPLIDYDNLESITQTSWFKSYAKLGCLVDLRNPQKSDELASDELLNERFTHSKNLLFTFLYLKSSKTQVIDRREPFIKFKIYGRRPTFKLPYQYAKNIQENLNHQKFNYNVWGRRPTFKLPYPYAKNLRPGFDSLEKPTEIGLTKSDNKLTEKKPKSTTKKETPTAKKSKSTTKTQDSNENKQTAKQPSKRGRPKTAKLNKLEAKESLNTEITSELSTQEETLDQPRQNESIKATLNLEKINFSKFTTSGKLDLNSFKLKHLSWFQNNLHLTEEQFLQKCLELIFEAHYPNLNFSKVYLTLQTAFDMTRANFKSHAQALFEQADGFDYITLYQSYTKPYKHAEFMQNLLKQFRFFVLKGPAGFINTLNLLFGNIFLDAWALNCSLRVRKPSAYYNKVLPGTAVETLKTNTQEMIYFLQQVEYDYTKLQLVQESWSLFAYLYTFGEIGYGRFNASPSLGLSALKSECKDTFLHFISEKTKRFTFVELDVKSCHTTIAFLFADTNPADLPDPQKLWPTLTGQFKEALTKLESKYNNSPVFNQICNWSDDLMKAVLKTQWYKILNNGNCFNAYTNLEGKKALLNIQSENLQDFVNICQDIFKNIPLIWTINTLQSQLTQTDLLYLPTYPEPFKTNTASRVQEAVGAHYDVSMTAMSRLFSNCEILVVMLIYIVIATTDSKLVPISYESDGLLLVGQFETSELPDIIDQINDKLTVLTLRIFRKPFLVEIKAIS